MKNAIIMLTCNRKQYTEQTLANYERQIGGRNDFFFFLCDNGSTDGTAEYLKSYHGPLQLEVTYNKKNQGIAESTKWLLQEKCFGKGFDFIIKVDDDEYLPDGWERVLQYWHGIETAGALFAGFRRKDLKNYFEGFRWISRNPAYVYPLTLGPFECYRSDMAPGVQISREAGWRSVLSFLSDYGEVYGGWDYTLMRGCIEQGRSCLVVWNYASIHFQNDAEYPAFTQMKMTALDSFNQCCKKKIETEYSQLTKVLAALEERTDIHENPKVRYLLERGRLLKQKLEPLLHTGVEL